MTFSNYWNTNKCSHVETYPNYTKSKQTNSIPQYEYRNNSVWARTNRLGSAVHSRRKHCTPEEHHVPGVNVIQQTQIQTGAM